MIISHYKVHKMHNISNLALIFGMSFPKNIGRARVGMQLHMNNLVKQVGFWAMDILKASWDDNT